MRQCARTRSGILAAIGAGLLGLASAGHRVDGTDAMAGEARPTPVFPAPTAISNSLVPFVPGAVSVHAGTDHGAPMVVVVTHLAETRDFAWNGTIVTCRVVDEMQFRRGVPAGSRRTYLAQSADGAVWTFGDVEDRDPKDDGGDDANDSGWIVGARAAFDPPAVLEGASPAMLMPAAPAAGDAWTSSDFAPDLVERSRVTSTVDSVSGPGGRWRGCVRVRRTDVAEHTTQTAWFAPGRGLVQTRGEGERTSLRASTLGTGR